MAETLILATPILAKRVLGKLDYERENPRAFNSKAYFFVSQLVDISDELLEASLRESILCITQVAPFSQSGIAFLRNAARYMAHSIRVGSLSLGMNSTMVALVKLSDAPVSSMTVSPSGDVPMTRD